MGQPTSWDGTRFTHAHGTVTDATGGTPDVEGRAQFALALAAMRSAGIVSGGTAMKGPLVVDQAKFSYTHPAAIADPTGGATIDTQSRTAVAAILVALRNQGIIAGPGPQTNPTVWDEDVMCQVNAAFIASPTGGATVDTELRAALVQAINALRSANIVALD
jgi:hypothetical protein